MATSEMTIKKTADYVSPTRQRVMGILFLVIAFSIWFFFSRSLEPGLQTTFGLTPGGSETQLPDVAAHDGPGYQEALRALGDGADREIRIVEGLE